MTEPDFKKLISGILDRLKKMGWTRDMIGEKLGYKGRGLDQMLSKGGSEKLYKSLTVLEELIKSESKTLNNSTSSEVNEEASFYGGNVKDILVHQNKLIHSMNRQSETATQILDRLANQIDPKIDILSLNLTDALGRIDSLRMGMLSQRYVVLQSLARIEKKDQNSLLNEADSITESFLDSQKKKRGKKAGSGK